MIDYEREQISAELKGSLLEFSRFFFQHLTKRSFILTNPPGRESHQITVCRALTKAFYLEKEYQRLIINLPPGYGKSSFVSMWIAWSMAHYPDSQYLYISYSHDLAAKHTAFIKQIVGSQMYKYLFNVELSHESRAKDFFRTVQGGSVRAFGSMGAVLGQDGGLPGLDRCSGAVIIDDPIKPDAGHSESIRQTVTRNYEETIRQRVRGLNVPIIFIGQRIHEDDLSQFLLSGKDVREWHPVMLKALDDAGNALYPEKDPVEDLIQLRSKSPYVFASQYQQDPLPAGGALYKEKDFAILDEEPKILTTFITADTSETSATYNDATAFSFWGIYQLETGELALHWLDAVELHIEPKYLKEEFVSFYDECMLHSVKPKMAAIEKKSTGVTLVSILEDMRGLEIRAVKRTAASGSKTTRFLEMQPIIASKLISFTYGAKHSKMCIEHMTKITANDSHRRDDLADTCYDACKIALIDKTLYVVDNKRNSDDSVAKQLSNQMRNVSQLRARTWR